MVLLGKESFLYMEEEIIFTLNLELIGAGEEKQEVKKKTKIKRKEVNRERPYSKIIMLAKFI